MTDQVPSSYVTRGKIIVFYTVIFVFKHRQEDRKHTTKNKLNTTPSVL
jgi:hypothetical protein